MRSQFTSAMALWKRAQLAQILGLGDGRGDRGADPGSGWDMEGELLVLPRSHQRG